MATLVDAQFLITTESMTVTSAMRKNSRWVNAGIAAILGAPSETSVANSWTMENSVERDTRLSKDAGVEPSEETSEKKTGSRSNELQPEVLAPETELIMSFAKIRPEILGNPNGQYSTLAITKPFLEVIKSPLVSGHITSLALTSIERFLILGVLKPDSKDIKQCLNDVVHVLTHCRFEATDRQEDDAVLLQLMALLDKIVAGSCGTLLTEKAIGEIVETCMSMAKQMKRRDTLRRSVIATLMSLVRTVFSAGSKDGVNEEDLREMRLSAKMILTTLVQTLDPSLLQHTNSVRITVLSVLKLCFEMGGDMIAESPEFHEIMLQLWKSLAQIIRVTSSPKLVKEALQLVLTMMNVIPKQYKVEFEFILVYLLTSLTPLSDLPRDESTDDMFYAGVPNRAKCVKSAPIEPGSNILSIPTASLQKTPEIREVMIEALATMAVSSSSFFSDLFITYDCDRASPDLCEDLVGFLCRNAYPDSATWSTSSVPPLCLEAVLSGLSAWADFSSSEPLSDELKQRIKEKGGKAVESYVAEKFNQSPSKGIAEMVKSGLIGNENPREIAQFLHSCKLINKAVLGKFFSKSENKEVLEFYVKNFDFTGKRIDEALRTLLCSLRLPGESAQIENVLQKFADHYIESGEKVEKNSDSAFILAYAVMMLNTDHYSPTLKRRMDFESFKRNVQGVDKDIPDDYVQAIFDGITTREIIMPEEHDTDETFEHSWRENVLRQQSAEPYFSKVSQSEVVKAVFETNWRPVVSTLSFVFATATDDLVFRRVITGFHQLAQLAARFQSDQALTHIIACLSQISALSSGDLAFPNSNIEIRIEDHVSVIVSDLSTQFGGDLKAQMASITLFRILNVAAKEVGRTACGLVAKALTNLHIYGLGTPSSVVDIKPPPPFHTFERPKAGKPVGIFSALSSYLTSSPDTPPEPSDENVDAALGAAECIKACKIDETILSLISNSAASFAKGAIDVLPKTEKHANDNKSSEKDDAELQPNGSEEVLRKDYAPAKDFLLRLAGRAAIDLPDLREEISKRASKDGFVATALSIATENTLPAILNGLTEVDGETVDAVLKLSPSSDVWRLVGLVQEPSLATIEYIAEHANSVDEESILSITTHLKRASRDGAVAKETIRASEALAAHFRHKTHYSDLLGVLGSLSGSSNGEIREAALSSLQGELLQEDQKLSWAQVAESVLIPDVLEVLLKPEVWKRDPSGMDLTRQQAAAMLGKVFLHLTVSLDKQETETDVDAWIATLRILDRLLSSRKQPALQESIVEMLKNVILVTKLASRGTPQFWERTQTELKGFLPQVAELATNEPVESVTQSSTNGGEPEAPKEASTEQTESSAGAETTETKEHQADTEGTTDAQQPETEGSKQA